MKKNDKKVDINYVMKKLNKKQDFEQFYKITFVVLASLIGFLLLAYLLTNI
jgi:hypothetical protein